MCYDTLKIVQSQFSHAFYAEIIMGDLGIFCLLFTVVCVNYF